MDDSEELKEFEDPRAALMEHLSQFREAMNGRFLYVTVLMRDGDVFSAATADGDETDTVLDSAVDVMTDAMLRCRDSFPNKSYN
jgi:hypothetical protein